MMNPLQICGVVMILLTIILIGVWSGRHVKNASDFEFGKGYGNAGFVSGIMMGTLIGGSSTIGTAQLAYTQGISASWYALSCGIACLVIALLYIKPFRHAKVPTLLGIIHREYGSHIELISAILVCFASFVAVIPQLIASSSVLPVIFPGMSVRLSVALTAGLILIYVAFGGALGASLLGRVKIILLYIAVLFGIYIVMKETGLRFLWDSLDHSYFDLFANGIGKESSKALSVILGVVTSQLYMQAVTSASSDRTARRGELISAFLIPPVGIASALIGMFMRVNHPNLANSKDAFSQFVLLYMPDFLGGIVLATLLLAIVGSSAGSLLNLTTIIHQDIIAPRTKWFDNPKVFLLFTRLCIVCFLTIACLLSTGILGDIVLNFTTAAAGLQAATLFAPLMYAMLFPGKIDHHWVFAAVIVGAGLSVIFSVWNILPIDGLSAGFLGSVLCCACGAVSKKLYGEHAPLL